MNQIRQPPFLLPSLSAAIPKPQCRCSCSLLWNSMLQSWIVPSRQPMDMVDEVNSRMLLISEPHFPSSRQRNTSRCARQHLHSPLNLALTLTLSPPCTNTLLSDPSFGIPGPSLRSTPSRRIHRQRLSPRPSLRARLTTPK